MEALRFQFLSESSRLSEKERKLYRQLTEVNTAQNAMFDMTDTILVSSLKVLSQLLSKHYDSKVIILIMTPDRIGVVVEIKYAEDGDLLNGCAEALDQIEEKRYDAVLIREGVETILRYGIAFYKKGCKVVAG